MKKLPLYITAALVLLMNAGCSNSRQDIDWKGMEEAEKERNERVRKELLAYMSLETMFPDESVRALAKAAAKGRVRTVEELVNSGVDVNSSGTQGATPLFWAMSNYKGFKKLLELGADPNVIYGDGGTVMHWAVQMNDNRFLEAALEHGGNPNLVAKGSMFEDTPIFQALSQGIEKVEILLEAGANIDAQNNFGTTPVMTAFGRTDFDVVYYLLERGANYKIKNNAGWTLANRVANAEGRLIPKAELERLKVVEWLESRGVAVEKKQ